ncbi:hypothetical protein [Halorubrum vacuolatum]|uniref:hypothetical protein n=1 Tax=Halorubrum vacuolatum TaxID=63740 RepID=UPI000B78F3DC|nr:hypothetical protein [Halorubrum vacuolatum]
MSGPQWLRVGRDGLAERIDERNAGRPEVGHRREFVGAVFEGDRLRDDLARWDRPEIEFITIASIGSPMIPSVVTFAF